MSSATACQAVDRDKIIGLLDNYQFEGFVDLVHLSKVGRISQLAHRLADLSWIDWTPFPASIAIVRALIRAHQLMDWTKDTREFADNMRFGFWCPHLPSVMEATYSEFQAAFAGTRFKRDAPFSDSFLASSHQSSRPFELGFTEWREFGFYHVPPTTLDAMWDAFRMDDHPNSKIDSGLKFCRRGTDGNYIERPRPVLVGNTRNRNLPQVDGRSVPVYSMSHPGSGIVLSLVVIPRIHIEPSALVAEAYPALAKGGLRRELVGGEAWLIAGYEPPPVVYGIDDSNEAPDDFDVDALVFGHGRSFE